jgi:hypothetical protein
MLVAGISRERSQLVVNIVRHRRNQSPTNEFRPEISRRRLIFLVRISRERLIFLAGISRERQINR